MELMIESQKWKRPQLNFHDLNYDQQKLFYFWYTISNDGNYNLTWQSIPSFLIISVRAVFSIAKAESPLPQFFSWFMQGK